MIRSTRHSTKFANAAKRQLLANFIDLCREAAQHYVDHLWEKGYSYNSSGKEVKFSVAEGLLSCPRMIDYKVISFPTTLSARALSSVSTQACGIIAAATEKQARRLWKLQKLREAGQDTRHLEAKIAATKLVKPTLPADFAVELSSKCADLQQVAGRFNWFLRLKCLGGTAAIKIPVKSHAGDTKWKDGQLLGSFLVSKKHIDFRYKSEIPKKVSGGTVGADQGMRTLLTLSDGQSTDNILDPHLHTSQSIYDKLERQKRGSKANRRTQQHLKNHIGYCLNRLDFSGISRINLEDMTEVRRGRRQSRRTSYFNPGVINERLGQKAESLGVQVELTSCTYRSQRCHKCGWVQKANRSGKKLTCKKCGETEDADLNAARNLAEDLIPIPTRMRRQQLNLKGFYWIVGQEPESLISPNEVD